MTDQSAFANDFPNHKYDFGDRVYLVPCQQSGIVTGIRYDNTGAWWYHLSHQQTDWWAEDQLEPSMHSSVEVADPCDRCKPFPES